MSYRDGLFVVGDSADEFSCDEFGVEACSGVEEGSGFFGVVGQVFEIIGCVWPWTEQEVHPNPFGCVFFAQDMGCDVQGGFGCAVGGESVEGFAARGGGVQGDEPAAVFKEMGEALVEGVECGFEVDVDLLVDSIAR